VAGKEDKNKKLIDVEIEGGYIKPRNITQEMQESYLDYAMSVIVARALPDVRDGLKPVHRRILFAMSDIGLRYSGRFRKSATIVGETLGKYHPHGDSSVYDAMVRMAQDFSMRYPLVFGQGNFGSMDGDSAAAMRYTEAKMARITEEVLFDIDKDTVNFVPNYDGSKNEPSVLPSRLPQLLLNGSMGIAVGMATAIPPHNLTEVADAVIHVLDNPDATVEDLCKFIKGPDFPTGGIIYNTQDIVSAYATGKGRVVTRAVAEIEEKKGGKFKIVITEIPYQQNKATLVEKIAELVKTKRIIGISDLRDESSREGVRVVIELKKDAYPKKILNQLYKYTSLQTAFNLNIVALVDGIQPRLLTLKELIAYFIDHRKVVVRRRTEFELRKAKDRAHILEGLLIATSNIDKVIKTIKESKDRDTAKKSLIKLFKLSELQAEAILMMRLQSLAALERYKIEEEYKALKKLIKELEAILKDSKKILAIIKEETEDIKEKYGDARRTRVVNGGVDQFNQEDLIPNEPAIVALTTSNYIKRMPPATYRSQARGGKGIIGMTTRDEDIVEHLMLTNTHDNMLFFTNRGRVFQSKVYDIPIGQRTGKGQALVNVIQMAPDEKVTAMVNLSNFKDMAGYLFMATKKGFVKKTEIEQFKVARKSGLIAVKLKQDDELSWVKSTTGKEDMILVTRDGKAIRFSEKEVRPMGRATSGVRGIKLSKDDFVIGIDTAPKDGEVLVVMENGYGKRTEVSQYTKHHRGGSGIKVAAITPKTGNIVDMRIRDNFKGDLVVMSENGQVIRIPVSSVSKIGRATQGVRIMSLKDNDRVTSIASLEIDDEIEEEVLKSEKSNDNKSSLFEQEVKNVKKEKDTKKEKVKKSLKVKKPVVKSKIKIKTKTKTKPKKQIKSALKKPKKIQAKKIVKKIVKKNKK
jgi:DNA gyrase subunit A